MTEIPDGVRVAVYNAMGGWGPYSVREISELFRTYGFRESDDGIGDIGGVRRTTAEAYQRCINWDDEEQRRRYLMLVEDVLEHYPQEDGVLPPEARSVRRALKLAGAAMPSESSQDELGRCDDLWGSTATPRIFISHLASRKGEVHALAKMVEAFGFACFVTHEAIEPSRSWQREIERALKSCDVLVAYITPGFSESRWTDQEVGWALGRDLIAVPIAVDGENPYGFIGSYQAVKRGPTMTAAALSRLVFRAIVDAVFTGQRPGAAELVEKVAPLAVAALGKARSAETARVFFDVLQKMPKSSWTADLRRQFSEAVDRNEVLEGCTAKGKSIAEYLAELEASGT